MTRTGKSTTSRNEEEGEEESKVHSHRKTSRSLSLERLLLSLRTGRWSMYVRRLLMCGGAVVAAWSLCSRVVNSDKSRLSKKPQTVGYYFSFGGVLLGHQSLPTRLYRHHRTLSVSHFLPADAEIQRRIDDGSEDYLYGMADPLESDACQLQHDWQAASYPTCNLLHDLDLAASARIINDGYWRDVWIAPDGAFPAVVLKTIRWQHDWVARNYERHRRDSIAMERLSSSPYVMDIYAFCGNSGIFEFSDKGDLNRHIWPGKNKTMQMSSLQMLQAARQVSLGIADMHNVDIEGIPSIAHTDITPKQFLLVENHHDGTAVFKLNDFNRCRLLTRNRETSEICPFLVSNNPGSFRSPEEYMYADETEKVDVYSMGNIFYSMLTKLWPFEELNEKRAQKKIRHEERPPVDGAIVDSDDVAIQAIYKAMLRCWVHDPKQRATAREIATSLTATWLQLV